MIISEIQSEIGHCSCDGAKFKAPADFSRHAILLYDIVLKLRMKSNKISNENGLVLTIDKGSKVHLA